MIDILNKKEYNTVNLKDIKLSDQLIVQSFKTFSIDFSEPTTASNIRSVYTAKISSENRKNRLDQYHQSYAVLITLVKSTFD